MQGLGLQGCVSGCWHSAIHVKVDALRPAFAHVPACAHKPACRASSPVRAQAQDAPEPELEQPRGIFETYPQSAETVTILDARHVPPVSRKDVRAYLVTTHTVVHVCLLVAHTGHPGRTAGQSVTFITSFSYLALPVRKEW